MKKLLLTLGMLILFSTSNVMAAAVGATDDFITVWTTSGAGESITLPMIGGPYDVDWENDGTFDDIDVNNSQAHTYGAAGSYTVRVRGSYTSFSTSSDGVNAAKLTDVSQWGTQAWTSMNRAFYQATNLTLTATDTPNFSLVTNMAKMFYAATSANPNTTDWNTSAVTNMSQMFYVATVANPDTSGWDTSAVTNMAYMFSFATSANPDTTDWNTSAVTKMQAMFENATKANPNTGGWDTSAVTNMAVMFTYATSANPNTGGWNTTAVTNMQSMFYNAASANPNTTDWNTSAVTNMSEMFRFATSANPNTGGWKVTSLTNAADMLTGATSFTTNSYNKLLISWGNQSLQSGVSLGVGTTVYCSAAAIAARAVMTGTYSWNITDGGEDCPPEPVPASTPIPTLSVWGLGILAGLLGFIGFVRRRKV